MSSSRDPAELQTPHSAQVPGSFPTDPISPSFQAQRNLAQEVYERRDEYLKTEKLRIKIGSWNVAALPGTVKDLEAWFAQGKGVSKEHGGIGSSHDEDVKRKEYDIESVGHQEKRQTPRESTVPKNDPGDLPGGDEIGIYALGLQEIVDVNSGVEALRPYNDPHPSRLWKEAASKMLPPDYVLIAEQQLMGLLLLVYTSQEIAATVSSVSATHVGTGLMGYMGNKGAVAVRIVLGERTKVVFVNAHLAAGNDKGSLERRNWDFKSIMQRTRFDPVDHGNGVVDELGDGIGEEDIAFWFGDLNYRLGSIPGDDVRRLLLLHTRNEYDTEKASSRARMDKELKIDMNQPQSDHDSSSTTSTKLAESNSETSSVTEPEEALDPSDDPASLQTTISSLIVHDQLQEQMRLRKAFSEGWREGPVKFLPTYKYDVGSVGMFDSSEKKRAPSWCDRILFRTRKDYVEYKKRKREEDETKKRDAEMKARGLESGADEVIFDYDPDADGNDEDDGDYKEDENGVIQDIDVNELERDRLQLDFYTSHQRVLSSDHKPLDAIFTLEYEAIDLDRKAAIHQEVAREMDKAENEGRPAVTVAVDHHNVGKNQDEGCYFSDLQFREQKSITLTIANTSPVPATFNFLAKEGQSAKPSWLRFVFHHETLNHKQVHEPTADITLEPGDSTDIEVIAQITHLSDLTAFNEGIARPEDILILRVRNGRDHFIPVQAHWLRSCFGVPLDKLVRLPKEGARSQPLPAALDKDDVRWSAPRELFRLTESLEENLSSAIASPNESLHEITNIRWPFIHISHPPDLHHNHSFQSEHADALLSIRNSLDTAAPISIPASLSPITKTVLLASTLTLFLSSMPGRLIPITLWTQLSISLASHERSKQPPLHGEDLRAHILDILSTSPIRSVSFTFVTFMLQRIVGELSPLHPPENHKASHKSEGKHSRESSKEKVPKPTSPLSPKGAEALLRRARGMSLSSSPSTSESSSKHSHRRHEIEKAFVDVFVPLVFEEEDGLESKLSARARKAEGERKKIVLEVFLRSKDDD
ncbi:hypothetical protein MMC10_009138 [Thelotrema lepadinum]|nr:hypothetical protein [Thelotrema lepadinum]